VSKNNLGQMTLRKKMFLCFIFIFAAFFLPLYISVVQMNQVSGRLSSIISIEQSAEHERQKELIILLAEIEKNKRQIWIFGFMALLNSSLIVFMVTRSLEKTGDLKKEG
jgi:hypothetical protein